jgi:Pectate lyase superfamily protein
MATPGTAAAPWFPFTTIQANQDLDTWIPSGRLTPDVPTLLANNLDFNVLDYLADPTNTADSTAAFNAALAAAGAVQGRVRIPPGSYKLTNLIWPNKQIIMEGSGMDNTILQFSGNNGGTSPCAFYVGHYSNANGSRFSSIRDIQIRATGANTALRINNLGMNLKNVWCNGGSVGLEVNCCISASWDTVITSGTSFGTLFQNAGVSRDPSSADVTQLNTFNQLSGSATGATGIQWGSNAGENTTLCMDAEQCGTGIRCIAGGLQRNTHINAWCEVCTVAWVTEDAGCSNIWINQYVRVADGVSQTFGTTTGYILGNILTSPALQGPTVTSGLTVTTGSETISAGNLNLSNGVIGIGSAAAAIQGIRMLQTLTGGATQTGALLAPTFDVGCTTAGYGIHLQTITAAAAFTLANAYGIEIQAPTIGAGSAITNLYGIYLETMTAGGTLNYAIYTNGGKVSLGDILELRAAASQIVPGATSLSLRNHANSADNLLISDAGSVTVRAGFGVNGATAQTAAASGGAVATTAPTQTTPYGFTTSAQAAGIITLLNNIRAALVANGIMS